MFRLVAISALLAVAAAAPGYLTTGLASPLIAPGLPATLLPRVAVAPAQTTIVRQPIVVDEPTPVLRSVPVPIRAVSYAAPQVITPQIISTPQIIATPIETRIAGAPLISSPYLNSPLIGSPFIGSPLASPYLLK